MSWNDSEREDTTIYKAVVNHEEQYSIWPADRENPLGWKDAGKTGAKAECLQYIKEIWTDMRPLSLRIKMEEDARRRAQEPVQNDAPRRTEGDNKRNDLVMRLSEGNHPIEVSLRPEKSVPAFKERIDLGYVHIKFTGTRGGTELGVRLDQNATDLSNANFDQQDGTARLKGGLTLNYQKVNCVAEIDLKTLTGTGHLEVVQ